MSLIKGHVISVQIKAALAVEVLADHNENSQAAFLALDTGAALIRLLKVFSQLALSLKLHAKKLEIPD